jgi:hypothetical protein
VVYRPHPQGRLELIPESGDTTQTLLRSSVNGYEPAAWSPDHQELLFWTDPEFSSSIAADGLALSSLNLTTRRSTPLGTTLTHRSWIAWSPLGHEVAVVVGTGRAEWSASRRVELCTVPAMVCSPLPTPRGTVGLDPTFSDQGTLIFTVAPGAGPSQSAPQTAQPFSPPWSSSATARWYHSQELYLEKTASSTPTPLLGHGTHSATAAQSRVLFIQSDALWYQSTITADPQLVATSIGPPKPYRDTYYGYLNWDGQYAWHR